MERFKVRPIAKDFLMNSSFYLWLTTANIYRLSAEYMILLSNK